MKGFLERIPLPMCGLMLALASMGNLLAPFSIGLKYACGTFATILAVILVLKAIFDVKSIVSGLENPAISGVLATFSMGVMTLATYIAPFAGIAGHAVWYAGLVIHVLLLISYSARLIAHPVLGNLYPSSFIPFVGLAVVSTTAPGFGMNDLGVFFFWFALIAYFIALPAILFRVIKVRNLNAQTMPLMGIFAAPASLCLLAYLTLFRDVNVPFMAALAALALASTAAVVCCLPSIIKREFYPSYAALGFPFVVSALAMSKLGAVTSGTSSVLASAINALAIAERLIAVAILSFVLVRYLSFLLANPRKAARDRP